MANHIGFNDDYTITQPSTVKENLQRKVVDKTSIKGQVRRIWLDDKWQATLTWSALTQDQYNVLKGYLWNESNPITYYNDITGLKFSGFPTTDLGQFLPGNQWLRSLTVTIEEQ